MGVFGTVMVMLSTQTAMAVPVLFIVFIIRAIMRRRKKWLGLSIAICAALTTVLFFIGCALVGSDEEFIEEHGTSLETQVATETTAPPETTVATTTRPPETTTTQVTTATPPETTTTEPPITFEEVYIAYQKNELRASEMYKGERVRISGTVDTIGDSFLGVTTLWVVTYVQGESHYILCSFVTNDNKDDLMALNTGDYITFEGTCTSWSSWGLCEIVD